MTPRFKIYLALVFLVFLLGVVRYKKLSTPFRILTVLIGITIVSEITSRILINYIHNSSPAYHFFIPIQFVLLFTIYGYLIESFKNKAFLAVASVLFVVLCFINFSFLQGFLLFPSNVLLLSSVVFIILSLLIFHQMFNSVDQESLFIKSVFWFNCAILLFFTVTFLFWSFYNYLLRHKISTRPFATFIYYVNIVYYLMLACALALDDKVFKTRANG